MGKIIYKYMKRIIITIYFLLLSVMNMYSQEIEKKINFIISIDDQIVSSIARAKIIIDKNDNIDQIEIGYIPGELIISNADFEQITQDQVNSFLFSFDYYEYKKERQIVYNYEIEINKVWLEQSYRVLRIYNLNKKKNRKIFYPLKGKQYTYEVDLPSNSIVRIRKK